MSKAIIRIQKLKSAVAVRRSMKHAFREQETPNADASRSQENTHLGPQSTATAMQLFNFSGGARVASRWRVHSIYLQKSTVDAATGCSRQPISHGTTT